MRTMRAEYTISLFASNYLNQIARARGIGSYCQVPYLSNQVVVKNQLMEKYIYVESVNNESDYDEIGKKYSPADHLIMYSMHDIYAPSYYIEENIIIYPHNLLFDRQRRFNKIALLMTPQYRDLIIDDLLQF